MQVHLPRTVGEVMTKNVLGLSEDETLEHLEETMTLFKLRHLPVTDDGKLIGLVTHRDVLRSSASSLLPAAKEQTEFLARKFHVRDVMVRDVVTAYPDMPLEDAAHEMQRRKIGCLPVVDDGNRLVGIITESDFVRIVAVGLAEAGSRLGHAPAHRAH